MLVGERTFAFWRNAEKIPAAFGPVHALLHVQEGHWQRKRRAVPIGAWKRNTVVDHAKPTDPMFMRS